MKAINDSVNLAQGGSISKYAGERTRTTHNNSIWLTVHKPASHFRSEVKFALRHHLPDIWMVFAPDGIGTKVAFIDAIGGYRNGGRDIIAMTAGDITRSGGCPVAFTNVLDVSSLGGSDDQHSISPQYAGTMQLIDGLVDVANLLKFPCIKGETAELSVCVSSPNPNAVLKFNWSGMMLGITHASKEITGNTLAAGQIIIALKEYGFRSNGISAVRGTMEKQFGEGWWEQKELIEQIATPSTIYDHFFTHLNGWYNDANNFEHYIKPHLICHLSGGSFKEKFFEDVLMRAGLSARLDDLWEPATIVKKCAEWSEMTDDKLYEKWSCGQGALVVLDKLDVFSFVEHAKDFGIEARVAGEIMQTTTPYLEINSKFSGRDFRYQ